MLEVTAVLHRPGRVCQAGFASAKLRAHLFQVIQPVHMLVGREIDADGGRVQGGGLGPKLHQALDLLGLHPNLCQLITQPNLYNRITGSGHC